jgi:hypothetical protein
LKYLLISLVTLSVLDAVLTFFLVRFNLGTESNPLLAPIVGDASFFVVKFLGAVLAALILWDICRRNRKLGLTATSWIVAAYSLIVLWNMSAFIIHL